MEIVAQMSFCSKGKMNQHGETRIPIVEFSKYGLPGYGHGLYFAVTLKWFAFVVETYHSDKGASVDGSRDKGESGA